MCVRFVVQAPSDSLQFCVRLQQGRQFLGQHYVAGNLQLALHERCLGIEFAEGNIDHILVGNRQCGVHLDALGGSLVRLGALAVESCKLS